MQQSAELTEQVRELMAEAFDVEEQEIPATVTQESYAKWGSLAHMTLVAALEERYSVRFTMKEMSSMTSLPKILATLGVHAVTAA